MEQGGLDEPKVDLKLDWNIVVHERQREMESGIIYSFTREELEAYADTIDFSALTRVYGGG